MKTISKHHDTVGSNTAAVKTQSQSSTKSSDISTSFKHNIHNTSSFKFHRNRVYLCVHCCCKSINQSMFLTIVAQSYLN